MYRVLIVEDMDLTRDDIIHLIDWEKYGFELLPDARNGKIGLEYAKRYAPDIVITDIKMPVMTGLDMVEALMKLEKTPIIILLTAYEEFELAKRALQMGVQTFLLKYEIDEERLLGELNRGAKELKKRKNIEELKLREKLRHIMKGNFEVFYEEENILGWKGSSSLFFLQLSFCDSAERIDEGRLQDILEQSIEGEKFRIVYMEEKGIVIFRKNKLYLSETQKRDTEKHFAVQIQEVLIKELKKKVVIALGGTIRRNKDILLCWKKAEKVMQNYVFEKGSCILENLPQEEKEEPSENLKRNMREIEISLNRGSFERVLECLDEIRIDVVRNKNFYCYKKVLRKLMYLLEEKGQGMERKEIEERIGILKEIYRRITFFTFCEEFKKVVEIIEEEEREQFSGKIRYMKGYIQEHYAEEISLNDLADHIGMNSMYLSWLFKKEMGINFSAYLTKVRIEKAMELLKQGEYKIYEISQMVGYQTVQYFSTVFKKETGKSPKDFCR